jgi:hypothetical protein
LDISHLPPPDILGLRSETAALLVLGIGELVEAGLRLCSFLRQ